MKKQTKYVCWKLMPFFIAMVCFFHSAQSQQTARMTPNNTGYLEYLPSDYSTNPTKKYPLLIFLHGSNETGNGSPVDLEKVKTNGPPQLIQSGSTMCFNVNGTTE